MEIEDPLFLHPSLILLGKKKRIAKRGGIKMRDFLGSLSISILIILAVGIISISPSQTQAQFLPFWGMGMPGYSSFTLFNLNRYTSYPYNYMPMFGFYNYLKYSLSFFEMAQKTPFLYVHDPLADYYGAILYNYAYSRNISPHQAILPFIQESLIQ